jgi:phage FluMu protein Com
MEHEHKRLVRVVSTVDSEVRCAHCEKLLFKATGSVGGIDIRCGRCGTHNVCLSGPREQVLVTDAHGTILFVNNELERVTGYAAHQAIGQRPSLWGNQMPVEFYKKLSKFSSTKSV